ncbi:MAG TPA: M23 family metallopeptidase [Candidatus Omnitrophota bacterium]|nr:M23 family metallopeptidase [Candidatus Omnitrophota bacterium]HPN65972.1 M23 family metallopeptidase [Candidatus Omnitrophota bacterium]HRZ67080.1 M23 family metallopeptidase [Candidatus Omnitrophota bacterium]
MKGIIKRLKIILALAALMAAVVVLYKPFQITLFHLMEPKFVLPVEMSEAKVRSDNYGDGTFGARRNGGRLHLGIDLAAPVGTPVKAGKSGFAVSKSSKGMGKYVAIQHVDGTRTVYGHLSKTFVDKRGEKVKKGDIIGEVGKTGNAWNPRMIAHLHFELWVDGEPVDPLAGYMKVK